MSLDQAKKFLIQVMKEPALRERITDMEPSEAAASAEELGFELTVEELLEAEKEFRAERSTESPVELEPDELDHVAGGGGTIGGSLHTDPSMLWRGEDAPDGHEMGCVLTYHNAAWQEKNNIWCQKEFYCNGAYIWESDYYNEFQYTD